MATPTFRLARPDDFPSIRALLAEENLLVEDVAAGNSSRFFVAVQDGSLLACAGLEPYGTDGLLRSVAVAKDARHNQFGRILVDLTERDAGAIGVRRLYLLTTSAADYFLNLGYRIVERNAVPASLQASTQFTALCPASAACMTKATV